MNRSFRLEEQSSHFAHDSSFKPAQVRATFEVDPRLEGYDENFDLPLEEKHKCKICHLGLREPVQTSCGHRFCRGCIVRSMR